MSKITNEDNPVWQHAL